MRFHCLQHVAFESPGTIISWVRQRGHSLDYTHLYRGDPLPAVDEFEVLVIMGGPMSIHDEKEFPWLKKEKELIAATIGLQKKVIGICLGAQLIAAVSGGRVYPNPVKEIGFFPVNWTQAAKDWMTALPAGGRLDQLPDVSTVFHWHGETFTLPDGAVRLAGTDACINQAFLLGANTLGLQFHLEAEPAIIREMVAQEGHELIPAEDDPADATAAFIQTAAVILGQLPKTDDPPGADPGPVNQSVTEESEKLLGLLLNRFINN
jgi:GMP synthase-like glutamine amidotransferase